MAAGLSENFLFRLLVTLAKDYDFCERYFDLIPSDFFDLFPMQSRIHGAIKFYRDTYKKSPSYKIALPELLLFKPPEGWVVPDKDEQEAIMAFIEDVWETDLADREWIEDNLRNELQRISLKITLQEGSDLAQEENFSPETLTLLRDKLAEAESFSIVEELGPTLREAISDRLERRKVEEENKVRIPTCIGILDELLTGGGIPLKSLCLVGARSGIGKSAGLLHLCKVASLLKKFPALYVTLELSKAYVEDRFDASMTDTAMDQLVVEEKLLLDKYSPANWKKRGEIYVHEGVAGKVGVPELERLLNRLEREKGFIPKLICVDYADLMKFDRGRKERWLALEDLFIELRGLAAERDAVIWTASQINREGVDFAAGETFSGSDSKVATSDFAISVNRVLAQDDKTGAAMAKKKKARIIPLTTPPTEPVDATVHVVKSRFGPQNVTIQIQQDLARMNFAMGDVITL